MRCISSKGGRKERVCRWRHLTGASLSCECAAVLPLFFVACLTLILIMDAVQMQSAEELKLSNTARQLAVSAAFAGDVTGGKWIDIRKSKKYSWPVRFPGVGTLRVALRARVYPWVGSAEGIGKSGAEGEDRGEGELVYITDNEAVYHTDPNCSHIDLTVFKSTTSEIKGLRNSSGSRYRKCPGFPKNYSGPVYASATGDYYYPSPDYGSLTRHVHVVVRGDTGDLPPCSRCSAHHSAGVTYMGGHENAA